MTDFRINVIIDPKGAAAGTKVVERQLGRVESKANKVQSALRKAFAGLSIAFAVKEITQFAEAFTDLQNRLRLLVPEEALLVKTTRDLLRVANETRTAFEGTVILYQRLGLATRELGIGGGDLIGVVKSINQALILSGASAKEANNGLIQLSQGIAANRLGGDELRSTLEQLPAVADVIAKELGVTRGELRILGAEGKITGEIIIDAFRNAKDELEDQFGRTVPTLSQSFTVLKNNLTVFFGELNKGTGLLQGFGAVIRFVGDNIDTLARSLVVLGSTFAALRLAPTVQAFFELRAAVKAGNVVLLGSAEAARQKAIFDRDQAAAALTAAGAEVEKARTIIASTDAEVAASAATAQRLATEQAKLDIQLLGAQANLQAAQTGLAQAQAERANIATSGTLADLRARIAIADASVASARQGVLVATEQASAAEARLAAATSASGKAADATFAAEVRLAKAHESAAAAATAQAGAETRLATATAAANAQANIFTRALAKVRAAMLAVNAAIVANPIGAIVVALAAAISALVVFRDRIKVAGDGITTLGDLFRAVFARIAKIFTAIFDVIKGVFGRAFEIVKSFVGEFDFSFRDVVGAVASYLDTLYGVFFALFSFLGSLVGNVPDIFDRAFRKAVNGVITAIESIPRVLLAIVKTTAGVLGDFLKGVLTAVTKGGEAIDALFDRDFSKAKRLAIEAGKAVAEGLDEATDDIGGRFAKNFEDNFFNGIVPRLAEPAGKTFGEIAKEATTAFGETFEEFSFFSDIVDGIFEDAKGIAERRLADIKLEEVSKAREKAAAAAAKQAEEVNKVTQALRDEQAVLETTLAQNAIEGQIKREILALNNQLRESGQAEVTDQQREEIAALIRRNEVLNQFIQLQEELRSPQEELAEKTALINRAFAEGVITFEQYREAIRGVKLEQAELGTTVSDGLVTGMQKVSESLNDVASLAENAFVNAFSAAEDALVAFATGGSVTFKEFAASLIKDIARLVSRLLLLRAIQAAAGLGGPIGGFFEELATVGAPAAAATGSTMAVANKPFIVGEEGPELFTPGQTGSITPTDQTIGALASASSAQGQVTIVQAPAPEVNVQVVNVDSPEAARSAMNTDDGAQVIINQIRRNRSVIKQELGVLG